MLSYFYGFYHAIHHHSTHRHLRNMFSSIEQANLWSRLCFVNMRLMEEILQYLECIKPFEKWDTHQLDSRISSINSCSEVATPNWISDTRKFKIALEKLPGPNKGIRVSPTFREGALPTSGQKLFTFHNKGIPIRIPKHQFTNTPRIHGTGIFTYIYHKNQPNVGTYTIHGSLGIS